ncbi:conserved hypothetical protein [Desulforamulus reducens MI-1]|uniref:Sucrose phosphatase-like domain-containing protein n=1 Tax=Desulforamulus reducens (strain ATCC BAA-1160 / DSM 100696 / MI-1) TaxID=349161 RepID=A4J1D8_DESRM|nr:HAD family hydrolase [Desulforamulus reducens]ABO48891.1 conserved hypothetical protein [Desulforamulus reducens MI-1]
MIFASDLDRTLIYSGKFLTEFQGKVKAVETGKYYSYMTERAAELLKQVAARITFVPCTTRTIEQYRRIQFFQGEIVPQFAIVSNGANILLEGTEDSTYRNHITRILANECLAGDEILKEINKLLSAKWAQPMRQADGVFHYCIIDRDKAPLEELIAFSQWASTQKWNVSIQGRKLYLVPLVINKWSALERVASIIGDTRVFAAGDSLLDLPLMQGAHYAVSPAHGELYEQFSELGKWTFTETSGIRAGEQILEMVLEKM